MVKFFSSKKFSTQLVFAFLLFSFGTILGLGIPATWLLDRQTALQSSALLEQANQTTLALLENKHIQFQNLARLITERPTLHTYLPELIDSPQTASYLENLLTSSDLDALVVCDPDGRSAAVGISDLASTCLRAHDDGFILVDGQVWLIAFAEGDGGEAQGWYVVLGKLAISVFDEFSRQSGLEYLILDGRRVYAASAAIESAFPEIDTGTLPGSEEEAAVWLTGAQGDSYVAAESALPESPDLKLVSFLDITASAANNRRLTNLIYLTLAAVSVLGAGLAVYISRRISRPLIELAQAADDLRSGDLHTPLSVPSGVWEVGLLTNTLEDARVSLKHSLEQLQREKTWIESLLNSIIEGIITLDEQNRITFASGGIERILGSGSGRILGKSIDDCFPAADDELLFSSQLPVARQTNRISAQLNGQERLFSVSATSFIPPEVGNANRALVIRDISDEERIHRLMGDFMANITHEFRTPLASLAASAELLVEQIDTLSKAEIEQLLYSLNVGIVNLQSLIDNLLEAASIEAGRFRVSPHPEDLNEIITGAVDILRPISHKFDLEIKFSRNKQSIRVMADKRRTTQVLVNLLSNAIRHSPDHGTIEIATLIVEKDALVEVTDHGTGVPPDRLQHLFSRFAGPETSNEHNPQGFGLGLSVVKAIVEAQSGAVGYKDNPEGGARFWFTLPLAKAETE